MRSPLLEPLGLEINDLEWAKRLMDRRLRELKNEPATCSFGDIRERLVEIETCIGSLKRIKEALRILNRRDGGGSDQVSG